MHLRRSKTILLGFALVGSLGCNSEPGPAVATGDRLRAWRAGQQREHCRGAEAAHRRIRRDLRQADYRNEHQGGVRLAA